MGFFASVPQKGDLILYDEYIHASIRDGIRMSLAKGYKFNHNDVEDMKGLVQRLKIEGQVYIVTESVFSMDGDTPDLISLSEYCDKKGFYLIVDEAHAVGVFGNGLVPALNLTDQVFARIVTFGKALGCHGAAVLGSQQLKKYLVNFARSFIYTTGLPPHAVASIITAHQYLKESAAPKRLTARIEYFLKERDKNPLSHIFVASCSAIQCAVVPGNQYVKQLAGALQEKEFEVKPILSPTVPKGQERLRFCLHSYNSEKEISEVLSLLATFVNA